jgi:dihydrofolate reductase
VKAPAPGGRAADKERSMRKIISFHVTTLDGYYEGPNQEFDWPVVDEEFNEFSLGQLDEVDTLLFGRVTYELMASYWPTPAARQDDPKVAEKMNGLPKIVVSRSLRQATWDPSSIIGDDVAARVSELKQQPGKDIAVFGSSELTVSLLGMGLMDEVRVMVNPVVLGAGKSMFRTADARFSLKLLSIRQFRSGNVLLSYQPTTG